MPAGYCLRNQLYDYYYEDVNLYLSGKDVKYFISAYGGDPSNTQQVMCAGVGGLRWLWC